MIAAIQKVKGSGNVSLNYEDFDDDDNVDNDSNDDNDDYDNNDDNYVFRFLTVARLVERWG